MLSFYANFFRLSVCPLADRAEQSLRRKAMSVSDLSRRQFLQAAALVPFLARYHLLAAPEKKRLKIRDVQTMALQGARTYTLVKIVSDDGLHGIGEAYGSPGIGVKEQIHALKPWLVGKDPLEIDAIYTLLGERSPTSAARAPTARRTRCCAPRAALRWRSGTWLAKSSACR